MQINGWLIYSRKNAMENKSYIKWFIQEAALQDLSLKLILREDLTIGIVNNKRTVLLYDKQTTLPNFAIVRTIEPLLSLYLETYGIEVFNSSVISNMCNNKSTTHHHMIGLGIPMVDMLFINKKNIKDTPPMPFPFVVKESTGRSGEQVHLIETNEEWKQCIPTLSTNEIIVQACDVKQGKDVRVFVVGKEIVGAIIRESESDFRSNFKLGGSATWYPLDDEKTDMIHRIIQHYNFDMVGIDFLIDLDGNFLFNEIEDIVGSRTLSAVSDINILEKYITHIKNRF